MHSASVSRLHIQRCRGIAFRTAPAALHQPALRRQHQCQSPRQLVPPLSSSRRPCGKLLTASSTASGNGSTGNGSASSATNGDSSGTNGNSSDAAAAGLSNSGGNGSSGGRGPPGRRPGWGPHDGDQNGSGQPARFNLPWDNHRLSAGVIALAALSALLLLAVLRQASQLASLNTAMETVLSSLSGMADGPSTRDSVAALKRLLREVFAEQLSIKQRLTGAEKATSAAAQLEAADDYLLQQRVADNHSWSRAPVRLSGHVTAAGVLPWSQESSRADALSMLSDLGVRGAADAVLQLHSQLAGGKRRLTAEFCQTAHDGAAAALRLQALLFRVQARSWLQLMIAPLGGSLEALGRSITPVRGDYGCTHALRKGHGLTVLQQLGSGKAISLVHRGLSASAGFFVGGAKTGITQLQARSRSGHSLSLVAAHSRPQADASSSSSSAGAGAGADGRGLRFLGVQSPPSSPGSSGQQPISGHVLCAAGVLPIGDAVTVTAWSEKCLTGPASWGMALYCQPDQDGLELGMALGRASLNGYSQNAIRPLFCELSAKVPVGDGLSISPCAVYTHNAGSSSLAYVMQSCWRF